MAYTAQEKERMLYADMPSPSPLEIGTFVVCLAALIHMVYYARTLWLSFVPNSTSVANQSVTHDELKVIVQELKKEHKDMIIDLKHEVDVIVRGLNDKAHERMEVTREQFVQLREQYRELNDYNHKMAHELSNSFNLLGLKVERIMTAMEFRVIRANPKNPSGNGGDSAGQ